MSCIDCTHRVVQYPSYKCHAPSSHQQWQMILFWFRAFGLLSSARFSIQCVCALCVSIDAMCIFMVEKGSISYMHTLTHVPKQQTAYQAIAIQTTKHIYIKCGRKRPQQDLSNKTDEERNRSKKKLS